MTSNLLSPRSGNGYAQNSKLTQKPPAVKYRPDQYSSAGSGMAPVVLGAGGDGRSCVLCARSMSPAPIPGR